MYVLPKIPDGARVFWGSTIELFHESIPKYVLMQIFEACQIQDNLTHIFLTKQPQNLLNWSPFPDNCWIGVTATNQEMMADALRELHNIEAEVKYLSFEPLLNRIALTSWKNQPVWFNDLNWVIIGQQTPISPKAQPKIEWVQEIVEAADKAGVPVFLKDNLEPLLRTVDGQIPTGLCDNYGHTLRQEIPQNSHIVT